MENVVENVLCCHLENNYKPYPFKVKLSAKCNLGFFVNVYESNLFCKRNALLRFTIFIVFGSNSFSMGVLGAN